MKTRTRSLSSWRQAMRSRRSDRIAALCWLALAAFSCSFTSWVACELGADWRLYTALGLGAGLGVLVIGGLCCGASGNGG